MSSIRLKSSIAPFLVLNTCLLLVSAPGAVDAQVAPVRVEEIRLDPQAHVNEVRTVVGVVDRLVNRQGASSASFYLEDDYGHQILVIPFQAPPARGDRLTVTGVVTLDPAGDPVLTMFDASATAEAAGSGADAEPSTNGGEGLPADGAVGGAARGGATSSPSPPAQLPLGANLPEWAIPVGIVLSLVLVAAFFYNRGLAASEAPAPLISAPVLRHRDVDFATSALWPESDQQFDGRTLRFSRPDSTVRLMPAKLEVVRGGDSGEEIRFVSVEGERGLKTEMMFGRASGEGPSHVELKQKTVSRTHAVIRHRHGEWLLENLSMTNPTVLNDEVLGVQERLLTDGDRIDMGEVTFRFREL